MGLSWKRLVSKIHPPLPMSPRESARLLALLKASFKQQLDQRPENLPNNEHRTDLHLRSILNNPLFDNKSSHKITRSMDQPFGSMQDLMKRPMDVFREQASAGTASLQTARFCLQAEYNKCLASPHMELSETMRASQAGTTILDWLWALGLEQSGEVFRHDGFLSLLSRFIITEWQHERVLQWLRRLRHEATQTLSEERFKQHHILLVHFIKSELSTGQGLQSATAFLTNLVHETVHEFPTTSKLRTPLHSVASILIEKLSSLQKTAELQSTTLNPLIDAIESFSHPGSYIHGLKDMHLAQDRSPDSALLYFEGLSSVRLARYTPTKRSRIITTGLQTAELCVTLNRQTDAMYMMEFLQRNFEDEIGSPSSDRDTRTVNQSTDKAERQSLRLLDNLAIA